MELNKEYIIIFSILILLVIAYYWFMPTKKQESPIIYNKSLNNRFDRSNNNEIMKTNNVSTDTIIPERIIRNMIPSIILDKYFSNSLLKQMPHNKLRINNEGFINYNSPNTNFNLSEPEDIKIDINLKDECKILATLSPSEFQHYLNNMNEKDIKILLNHVIKSCNSNHKFNNNYYYSFLVVIILSLLGVAFYIYK